MQLPDFSAERIHLTKGFTVCGVDEAGRGPWAGPVVAAAVILQERNFPAGLNDSKKLTEAKREALFEPIMAAANVGVGIVDADVIDNINILQATYLAMQKAVAALTVSPHVVLVDGNRVPPLSIRVQMIIGGDGKSLSIAAASIIAKVTRDRIMKQLHAQYPAYGFDGHKGYGTALHAKSLSVHGPCPMHRKSFKPIMALLRR
jgi:ribonuclease HII